MEEIGHIVVSKKIHVLIAPKQPVGKKQPLKISQRMTAKEKEDDHAF